MVTGYPLVWWEGATCLLLMTVSSLSWHLPSVTGTVIKGKICTNCPPQATWPNILKNISTKILLDFFAFCELQLYCEGGGRRRWHSGDHSSHQGGGRLSTLLHSGGRRWRHIQIMRNILKANRTGKQTTNQLRGFFMICYGEVRRRRDREWRSLQVETPGDCADCCWLLTMSEGWRWMVARSDNNPG